MKKTITKMVIGLVLFLGLIVLFSSVYTVKENRYALVKEFSKIKAVKEEAGLYFKIPFIQEVDMVTKELLVYDIPKSDVITKDKKSMIVDSYVLWKIVDPTKFAQSLNTSITSAEGRIDVMVYNSIKSVISSMTQEEIIDARGETLTSYLMANIENTVTQYGIEIKTVDIKLLDLPEDNKDAVYDRMISERQEIAATYTAEGEKQARIIRNTTDKEATLLISDAERQAAILVAEGEAEYMRILSEAYNDESRAEFYTFLRSLDALKASMVGDTKTLILDRTSPLAQLFYE